MRSRSTGITSVETRPRKLRAPSVAASARSASAAALKSRYSASRLPASVDWSSSGSIDGGFLFGQHRRRLERDQPGEQAETRRRRPKIPLPLRASSAFRASSTTLLTDISVRSRSPRFARATSSSRLPWNPGASTVIEAAPESSRCIATWYGRRGYPDRRSHPLRGAPQLASEQPESSCPNQIVRSRGRLRTGHRGSRRRGPPVRSSFVMVRWATARAAISGRWVIAITWRARPIRASTSPTRRRGFAADARVHLVEHEHRRIVLTDHGAQGEREAAELASGGSFVERHRHGIAIGCEPKVDLVDPGEAATHRSAVAGIHPADLQGAGQHNPEAGMGQFQRPELGGHRPFEAARRGRPGGAEVAAAVAASERRSSAAASRLPIAPASPSTLLTRADARSSSSRATSSEPCRRVTRVASVSSRSSIAVNRASSTMISPAWRRGQARAHEAGRRAHRRPRAGATARVDRGQVSAASNRLGDPVGGGLLVTTSRLGKRQRADPAIRAACRRRSRSVCSSASSPGRIPSGPRSSTRSRARCSSAAPVLAARSAEATASTAARHDCTAAAVAARARRILRRPKASSSSRCQLRRSMRWLLPWAVTSTHSSPSSRSTACETSAPSIRHVARPDAGISRESVIRSSSGIPSSARRARRRGLGLSNTAATRAAAAPNAQRRVRAGHRARRAAR